MDFTVIGDIVDVETFAVGRGIREHERLRRRYGKGRWRKRRRKELKIKRYLN